MTNLKEKFNLLVTVEGSDLSYYLRYADFYFFEDLYFSESSLIINFCYPPFKSLKDIYLLWLLLRGEKKEFEQYSALSSGFIDSYLNKGVKKYDEISNFYNDRKSKRKS